MCANVHAIVMVYMGAWLCVRVFEMYLHCVCPSLVNVGTSCAKVWVVRVMFLYFTYLSPSFGRQWFTSEGLCRPSEIQQTADSDFV